MLLVSTARRLLTSRRSESTPGRGEDVEDEKDERHTYDGRGVEAVTTREAGTEESVRRGNVRHLWEGVSVRPVGESDSVRPVGESVSVRPVGESVSVRPVGEGVGRERDVGEGVGKERDVGEGVGRERDVGESVGRERDVGVTNIAGGGSQEQKY